MVQLDLEEGTALEGHNNKSGGSRHNIHYKSMIWKGSLENKQSTGFSQKNRKINLCTTSGSSKFCTTIFRKTRLHVKVEVQGGYIKFWCVRRILKSKELHYYLQKMQ